MMETLSPRKLFLVLLLVFIWSSLIQLSKSIPVKRHQQFNAVNHDAARRVLNAMDESANPCEDFYQYSCGHWPEHNPRLAGYPIWSNWYIIAKNIKPKIASILNGSDSPTDIEAIRKARIVYRACMNKDKIESTGIEPIRSIVNENGGWPLIMNLRQWEAKNITWQQVHTNLMKVTASEALFSIGIGADPKNSSYYRMMLGQPTLLLKRKELLNTENISLLTNYWIFIHTVADIFLSTSNLTDVHRHPLYREISAVIKFEKALAEIMVDSYEVEEIDQWYNLMTIGELQDFYNNATAAVANSQINWLETLRELFALSPEVVIDESEQLIVAGKDYLIKLADLLNKTPSKTVVDYMMWKAILSLSEFSNDRLRSALITFNNKREGADPIGNREEGCVVSSQMKRAVSYAFVTKYFPPEAKQAASEMIANLQEGMKRHLQQSTWMDDETKRVAVEKIDAIQKFIGYPDDYSAESTNNYYQEFIPTENYLENEIQNREFMMRKTMTLLRKPVDKNEWPVDPISVNAYYLLVLNSIIVPAGILQPPLYDPHRPSIINYAMIGAVLGHEISHALDSSGRRFDKHGDAITWWKQSSIDKYEDQAQCFIRQFNNYTIFENSKETIRVDGNLTLEENISDTTGLEIAWHAYKIWRDKHRNNETKLSGLERFTDDQLFFLAFGNLWCAYESDIYLQQYSPHDEHSPPKFRVNGAVSNNNVFAEAFNCSINSPVNPSRKCNI